MPRKNFATTPLTGSAVEQYEQAHWGVKPRRLNVIDVHGTDVKQRFVAMGKLRALYVEEPSGFIVKLALPSPYPWLAFGAQDNVLYFAGGCLAELARKKSFGAVGSSRPLRRVDYTANKGGKSVYWYHDHEPPFPNLVILAGGWPAYSGGNYRVDVEGIVG